MEWTVVIVLVTLVGLVGAIATPIIKIVQKHTQTSERNTHAMEILTLSMDSLKEKITERDERNTRAHNILFDKQREHGERIAVVETNVDIHENRIQRLEDDE